MMVCVVGTYVASLHEYNTAVAWFDTAAAAAAITTMFDDGATYQQSYSRSSRAVVIASHSSGEFTTTAHRTTHGVVKSAVLGQPRVVNEGY